MNKSIVTMKRCKAGLFTFLLGLLVLGNIFAVHAPAHAASASVKSSVVPHYSVQVPYYSQYQRQLTQNNDCGPAAVAMVEAAFHKGPHTNIAAVRSVIGGSGDTGFADLERAISYYKSSYTEITNAKSPQPAAQILQIQNATKSGHPVIALINAYDFGRNYDGHWIVITGYNPTRNIFYINDPDDQTAKSSNWIVGGPIQVAYNTVSQALYDAPTGSYGIIVNN
ncbi:hypothetical protein KDA_38120 [Dictyobacter alpinus]|uniref:Peptidase C39-like domain-containing protein n=1 Tax=Dictyobacter alpinus TaxID=2014873 RepID=A0A402BAB0_9CHLR|nr:peptidase C39 family protein [Dictyobacter alpinus]GCE28328.1 hypothetical protein KDA_38120 [Dictyobacter alpinus]